MKYTLLAIPFIALLLLAGYVNRPPTESEQVYNACMKAHDEAVLNMFDENYCGALQDEYNMEFVCESQDMKPETKCKVEEKK